MKSKKIELKEKKVIGITVRTKNSLEMNGNGSIPVLWGRFFSENLMEKILSKINHSILAIYSNYESDENGEYSFILGVEVSDITEVPEGMISFIIPASNYLVFTTPKGPIKEGVLNIWGYLWSEWKKSSTEKRSYTVDFEVYDERGMDFQNGIVDIFLAVK